MLFSDTKFIERSSRRTTGKRQGDAAAIVWTNSAADAPTTEMPAVASLTLPGTPVAAAAPTVTDVVATPASGTAFPGDTITITLDMSAAATVTGMPTLALNDGGSAIYSGGSGSKALTFTTVVTNSDRTVATLAITAVSLPAGAAISGASGQAANLAGAVTTLTGLGVDPPTTTPTLTAQPMPRPARRNCRTSSAAMLCPPALAGRRRGLRGRRAGQHRAQGPDARRRPARRRDLQCVEPYRDGHRQRRDPRRVRFLAAQRHLAGHPVEQRHRPELQLCRRVQPGVARPGG